MSNKTTTSIVTKKSDNNKANIAIDKKLWNNLRKIGSKGETYTEIIQRLYDFYVKENKVKGL